MRPQEFKSSFSSNSATRLCQLGLHCMLGSRTRKWGVVGSKVFGCYAGSFSQGASMTSERVLPEKFSALRECGACVCVNSNKRFLVYGGCDL